MTLSPSGAGLEPTRVTLSNGVVVLTKETRKTPAVSLNVAVRAGSMYDHDDALGAAHLLASVIDRGTVTRSSDTVAEELDGRGVSLTTLVTRHVLTLACTCLSDDFEPVLGLFADIVRNPSVPEPELAKRKTETVTAIRQDDDNPAVRAGERLVAELYPGGHPYGRSVKGSVAAVECLTREHVLRMHAERFAPGAVSLVVVGDVDHLRVADVATEAFGPWRRPLPQEVTVARPAPPAGRRRVVVPMMNKAQADIAYGFCTIARHDPAYYAYQLMNNVLGQYAMGGRLGDSIRERQGMAYYVSSSFDAGLGAPGPLVIRAGVSPANVDRTIASIDDELRRLRADGVTLAELDESRRYLVGSMPRALETNAGIAGFLQHTEFFGLGLDFDCRLPALLGAVTLDDVNLAAQALDPERATYVVAGPYQNAAQDAAGPVAGPVAGPR